MSLWGIAMLFCKLTVPQKGLSVIVAQQTRVTELRFDLNKNIIPTLHLQQSVQMGQNFCALKQDCSPDGEGCSGIIF